MRRPIFLAVGICAVAAIGLVFYAAWRDSEIAGNFRLVSEGMSREEVVGLMGTPDVSRVACRDAPTWMDRRVAESCSEELQYDAKLAPTFWTVGFDSAGRAIAKYAYVSP
jgi:hypothetical protein